VTSRSSAPRPGVPYRRLSCFSCAWRGVPRFQGHFIEKVTKPYRAGHDRWAFPALYGGDLPLHPLLAGRALLFGLSMLARYEPASWTTDLEADTSPTGVALEAALGHALDTCPVLIQNTIHEAVP
jgi:hypothetical protein